MSDLPPSSPSSDAPDATENVDSASTTGAAAATDEVATPPAPAPRGPGAILRAAREAAGLSQTDVSNVIRYGAHQIDALERDDFASLPGATVVRGFVRSYAKLLKLDATPLLASLEPVVPIARSDVREPTNMGDATVVTATLRPPVHLIAIGVIVISLLLALFWHFSTFRGEKDHDPPTAAAPPEKQAEVVAPAIVPLVAPSVATSVSASGAGAETVSAAVPASGATAQTAFTGLRLEFIDRSWIEVRDAKQQIVFVGEYAAGTKQNIEGKGPFYLWVGKASGMRVFFGERNIDLKPYTREDVARLTVE